MYFYNTLQLHKENIYFYSALQSYTENISWEISYYDSDWAYI